MISIRFQHAIPGLFGALIGAGVLGWGAGWNRVEIAQPNAVRWEAVEAIPGQVAVTASQLVAAALRHRPIGSSWEKSATNVATTCCGP